MLDIADNVMDCKLEFYGDTKEISFYLCNILAQYTCPDGKIWYGLLHVANSLLQTVRYGIKSSGGVS